jgi:hypothetical protein
MEISHYKRMAPNLFDMVDISAPGFNAGGYDLSAAAVQKHMHVRTPEGEIKIGVDAFAHIWSRLPKYKLAARIIKWPIIYSMAKIGYWIFATVRPLLPKKRRV